MPHEFDRFAASYDDTLKASLPAGMDEDGYFAAYKVKLAAASTRGRDVRRVLDFGCGAGRSLEYLIAEFPRAQISGFDPSAESIRMAAERFHGATLSCDWQQIRAQRYDVVFAANVFHHIAHEQMSAWLGRCRDVLAPGGALFVFEHNPHNPVTRRVFERCPFDVDAHMIARPLLIENGRAAGLHVAATRYTLFFPKPLKFFRPLERWLGWLPVGAQYCVEFAAR